jgi:hypothetical protein
MFAAFGLVADGAQFGNPLMSSRSGPLVGLRLPFWIIPGDLLLLAPILYFKDLTALTNIAISASNGGFLGIEKKIETPVGTVQLMAGRQIGVSLFGYFWNDPPRVANAEGTTLGNYRAVELDFPLLEYKAGHSFATKLAFDYSMQFGFAESIPTSARYAQGVSSSAFALENSSVVYLRFAIEGLTYW